MWPPRKQAITKSRIERGKYRCALCKGEGFGPKEIQLDHVVPVIDEIDGFVDFNTYIERLFCAEEGFQTLCLSCHNTKTFYENEIRKQVKHSRKKEEDDL